MKKCICYYKESDSADMSSIHFENTESSVCIYILDNGRFQLEADKKDFSFHCFICRHYFNFSDY